MYIRHLSTHLATHLSTHPSTHPSTQHFTQQPTRLTSYTVFYEASTSFFIKRLRDWIQQCEVNFAVRSQVLQYSTTVNLEYSQVN